MRKKPVFRTFNEKELDFVEWFKTGELVVAPGTTILQEGDSSLYLFTILDGWAFRSKALPDDRRQILSFALPGDLLGLQGPVLNALQHSVEALTHVRLYLFPRDRLWRMYESHPALAHDLVWLAARGERAGDEQLLSIGQRTAAERITYLLLHLLDRCRVLDPSLKLRFKLPLRQRHIADCLGLSLVHTNETLRRLEQRGLLRWRGEVVELLDEAEARRLSHFEPSEGELRPII